MTPFADCTLEVQAFAARFRRASSENCHDHEVPMNDHRDPSLWGQILNERSAILAFFGALGGAVRAAATKTTWREGVRVVFVGSATAFGVGALGPWVLWPWLGDLPDDVAGALGTLCAAAFLVGLIAVTLIERLIAGRKLRND
jgi:hypothetical protein